MRYFARAESRLPKKPKERLRSHFLGKKNREPELAPTVGSQSQSWLPTSNFGSFGSFLALSWELALLALSKKNRKEPKELRLFFGSGSALFFLGADMKLAPCPCYFGAKTVE